MTRTPAPTASSPAGERPGRLAPPELFDAPAISVEAAASLMSTLGFVAFKTPGAVMPDSCLMAMLRTVPTLQHFDPELATFWVNDDAAGSLTLVGPDTRMPMTRPFSWGRIRLVDRLNARNSFVTFGGVLHAERVAPHAALLVFRSTTPILRLRGHSQRADETADEILSFFGRLVPRLWDHPALEQLIAMQGPEALYVAFLLHSQRRIRSSRLLRESIADEAQQIDRALYEITTHLPTALAAARELSDALALDV